MKIHHLIIEDMNFLFQDLVNYVMAVMIMWNQNKGSKHIFIENNFHYISFLVNPVTLREESVCGRKFCGSVAISKYMLWQL